MPSANARCAGAAILAAVLGIGLSGTAALACGPHCRGYGYRPAPVYSAPPVYSYAYRPYGYGPVYRPVLYTTRVEIFRGPRWGYAAAYYNSPRRGWCRRHVCTRRAYISGPIVPISGPIGRRWRRW